KVCYTNLPTVDLSPLLSLCVFDDGAASPDHAAPTPPFRWMPATAALALALTNNPGEVLDMPVDPNEPTYCLCQQVSYGEMVACDNRDCPIEWFHFSCVAQHSQNESPAKENDETQEEKARLLDRKIEELKLRICDLRGIKDVSELDIEADLKRWREVLHEYNKVKDACQFLLGQLAHIKMTTVKDLYRHFGLDVND
ncbi:unnamed protein product, partial [Dibothriocephalus latus]